MKRVEDLNPYREGAKTEQVEEMFDNIAPAYDRMNRLMSLGFDRRWLRRLVQTVVERKPRRIVDMATGTGDVALALAAALPDASITGIDLSEGMLRLAREKKEKAGAKNVDFVRGDCLHSGLPDDSVDVITVAYGVRNFADIAAGYEEMLRILRPGGIVAVLELCEPRKALVAPFYRLYTRLAIPLAGKVFAGDRAAYAYLPASIHAAPAYGQMSLLMAETGFVRSAYTNLFPGVCNLYTAQKFV